MCVSHNSGPQHHPPALSGTLTQNHLLGMNQFPIHKHFKLPGSLCRYVLLLRRECWGWGKAKSSFQAPGALEALTTPTPLVTSTLTKCKQFGNCCSRLFFSRMYCRKEMKSRCHRVTGLAEMGNRNSFQTSCPTFSPLPKPKTTHPEVIASEATEGQGQRERQKTPHQFLPKSRGTL